MNEIVLAIIVVVVLLVILVCLFFLTIKRVDILIKKIFVDKLQEYDFLIEDREKRVEELNSNIETKKNEVKELVEKIDDLKSHFEESSFNSDDVVVPTGADFEDGNLLEGYKKIKDGFGFDYREVVKKFVEEELRVDTTSKYEDLKKIRGYFSHKNVYKISTYSSQEQIVIVNELLSDNEKNKIKNLFDTKKFSIIKFVNKLDDLIKMNDPTIYIYVADKNLNFDDVDKMIKTIYDEEIVEGFRIEYKGRVYDYSL